MILIGVITLGKDSASQGIISRGVLTSATKDKNVVISFDLSQFTAEMLLFHLTCDKTYAELATTPGRGSQEAPRGFPKVPQRSPGGEHVVISFDL